MVDTYSGNQNLKYQLKIYVSKKGDYESIFDVISKVLSSIYNDETMIILENKRSCYVFDCICEKEETRDRIMQCMADMLVDAFLKGLKFIISADHKEEIENPLY